MCSSVASVRWYPTKGGITCSGQLGNATKPSQCAYPCRLHKRQTSSDGIGYTAALNGDNHNQAVVHWTGYPSEHLFIVTRDRETNDIYSHSRESWLWRWVCPSLIISSIPSLLIHLVSCPTGQLTTATIFVMILTSSETVM